MDYFTFNELWERIRKAESESITQRHQAEGARGLIFRQAEDEKRTFTIKEVQAVQELGRIIEALRNFEGAIDTIAKHIQDVANLPDLVNLILNNKGDE